MSVSPKRTPTRYNLREAVASARERKELEKERTIALTLHMRKAAAKRTPVKRSSSELYQVSMSEKDPSEMIDTSQDKEIVFENSEQVDQLLDEEKAPKDRSKRRKMCELCK